VSTDNFLTRRVVAPSILLAVDADDPDSVPMDWSLQLHHYAWVTGIERAELAICRTGADFSVIAVPVPIDIEWYEASIVPRLAAFWRCVVDRVEPEPVPFIDRDPLPELNKRAQWAAARYMEAVNREKEAEAAKDSARAELLRYIDDAGRPKRATAGGFRISASSIAPRATIDAKGLREAHPAIADRFTRYGEPSITIRVTEAKSK
jgi:hypothetical protein